MKFDLIAEWLVIVGALNWGLVAFGFNLVDALLGKVPILATIVYVLVGVSGLYLAYKKLAKK